MKDAEKESELKSDQFIFHSMTWFFVSGKKHDAFCDPSHICNCEHEAQDRAEEQRMDDAMRANPPEGYGIYF